MTIDTYVMRTTSFTIIIFYYCTIILVRSTFNGLLSEKFIRQCLSFCVVLIAWLLIFVDKQSNLILHPEINVLQLNLEFELQLWT